MTAFGELIAGCNRHGWRVGLTADPDVAGGPLELRAVEVRDRDRELLAQAHIVVDDLEAAAIRAALMLKATGKLA